MSNIKLIIDIFIVSVLPLKDTVGHKVTTIKQTQKDTVVHIIPAKFQIENLTNQNSQEFDWSKNMPWIGAIIIGLTTVGANLIISNLSRRSSLKIAERQMDLAKTNSERDFKKTVISLNKQSWINDFRTNISDLISLAIVLATEQKFESEDHIKLLQLVTKAELMLSTDSKHKILSQSLEKVKNCCIDIIAGNSNIETLHTIITDIKLLTLEIISNEWEKARNAE